MDTYDQRLIKLQKSVRKMVSDAALIIQTLPEAPSCQLYLLDPAKLQRQFTQDEVRAIETYPAYWAFCWASGHVLAQQILNNPEWVSGKTVMDFGAGSGIVAVAAAKAGANRVIACDIDSDALVACQLNAELNSVNIEQHPDLFTFSEDIDVLIAADVLYDRANLSLLDVFLTKAKKVIVGDSRIRDFDHPRYSKLATYSSMTYPDLDEIEEFRHVTLYSSGPT